MDLFQSNPNGDELNNEAIFIINFTILTVYTVCIALVFIRISNNIETISIIYLAAYGFCFVLRVLDASVYLFKGGVDNPDKSWVIFGF